MATKKLLPGFKYLGGSGQRYLNENTGETISRRQYDKLVNPAISYEKKAAYNKQLNPEAAILRPARGRKSYVKADKWVQDEIAAQRLEAAEAKKKAEEQLKKNRKAERDTKRLTGKAVKVKKVKKHLIPPGRIGWRLPFNTWDDLKEMIADAKATRVIFAYALGFVGVDTRIGVYRPVMLSGFKSINYLIDEDDFYEMMEEALAEYAYMKLAHYFVQFAIDKKHAQATESKRKPAKKKGRK